MFIYKYAFIFVLLCLKNVIAFNILAIIAMPIGSHNMALYPLFRELARRGHNVTVINNFPREEPIPSLKIIDLQGSSVSTMLSFEFYETTNSVFLPLINLYRQIKFGPSAARVECKSLFTSKKLKEHYKAKEKYDVIFTELFTTECGLAYAGEMYDAPIIGIKSHVLMPTAYWKLGIPFNIAADSCYYSPAGTNPSLLHKAQNSILHFFYNTLYTWRTNKEVYNVFDKYVPGNKLDIERVAKEKLKMLFAYQHFSVTGGRLLPPQLLEIGGIHITAPKPVPEKLEHFLSDATNGAIYVSFGTHLKLELMSKNKLKQFLDTFKKLPYKIIWKINMTLPVGFENVYVDTWMPQLDILCNSQVIGFVSHGGMLSISESAHCGKPMLAIPFFGDQLSNSAMVRESGLGNVLHFYDLNSDSFENAIIQLTSKEMQASAKQVSRLWHDRPQSAMDSAIYWTEYVARHGNAPPSLPTKRTSWYENWLIDVLSVITLMLLTVFYICYVIYKVIKIILINIFNRISCKSKRKQE